MDIRHFFNKKDGNTQVVAHTTTPEPPPEPGEQGMYMSVNLQVMRTCKQSINYSYVDVTLNRAGNLNR